MMPDGAMRQPFEHAVRRAARRRRPGPAGRHRSTGKCGWAWSARPCGRSRCGLPVRPAETRLDPAPFRRGWPVGCWACCSLAAGAGAEGGLAVPGGPRRVVPTEPLEIARTGC